MTPTSPPLDFDTLDVRLFERWLTGRSPVAAVRAVPGKGSSAARVACFDTSSRALLRAGYSLRVQRRGSSVIAEFGASRGETAGVSEEIAEESPAALRNAPGPVGTRVRLLVGAA